MHEKLYPYSEAETQTNFDVLRAYFISRNLLFIWLFFYWSVENNLQQYGRKWNYLKSPFSCRKNKLIFNPNQIKVLSSRFEGVNFSILKVSLLGTGTDTSLTTFEIYNKAMNYESNEGQSYMCKNDSGPDCCTNKRFCAVGSFQSVLNVMRDSVRSAHALDIFWTNISYNGSSTSEFLKFPDYVAKSLTGIPTPLKDARRNNNLFLNMQPYIPLCRLYNLWSNDYPQWGTKFDQKLILPDISFCTFFKPGLFMQIR